MYVENDRVIVQKIMPNNEDELREFYESNRHRAMAIHVRRKSVGPIDLENCHPFWVTNLEWGDRRDVALMHNGTIQNVLVDPFLSDTGNFALHFLRPLLQEKPALYDSPAFWRMVSALIGKNKLVLLDSRNKFIIVNAGEGRILEDSGVWVSSKVLPVYRNWSGPNPVNVPSTPALPAPLKPENVSWHLESDGREHLQVVAQ